ncbi:MAG: hypothetical protein CFH06_00329 [Alphaproteobacteria bacterium MarineAlpha3_Bin5]|nr:hypothetical protein [Magnetovibrio sp.]PPR79559.1 MAG: hypothetical protein CFH06_00329 [Alphaproteobacteria bacterium MarineAlpha3_Bin5]
MTTAKIDLNSLVNSNAPGQWSEEIVWTVFCYIVNQASPLPGLRDVLGDYREIFNSVFLKIKKEHSCCFWRYYREDPLVPLVNPTNIEHLTRLLHAFSNRLYKKKAPQALLDSLFYIMRSHCNINLFYRTQEIDFLFPLHAMGSVIGDGEFGPFIVTTQQCTIGQNRGKYPAIKGGLWMGPGSSILGCSHIGYNVRVAAHAFIIDRDVPDNVVVFGSGTDIKFKENSEDNRSLILDQGY